MAPHRNPSLPVLRVPDGLIFSRHVRFALFALCSLMHAAMAPAAQPDFNGDNQADLLWRNYKTGENSIWLMNGTTPSRAYSLTDVVSRETRSRMMAGIRGRNTKPELLLRRELHRRGYRYRLHVKELPGQPDLVLPRFRTAVFVQGCFWHRHAGCRFATMPKSNAAFWADKLERNVARDRRTAQDLRSRGWRVATIWECALRKFGPATAADLIEQWLETSLPVLDIAEDRIGPDI